MCNDCNEFCIDQPYHSPQDTYIKSNYKIDYVFYTQNRTQIHKQINLQILHKIHKGSKLNTLEQWNIYKHHNTQKNENDAESGI